MLYDIAIIGAGPCGLAVAARLREKTPSALFTNDEHARYWKKHGQHRNSLEREYHRTRKASADSGYGSSVDDESGKVGDGPSMIVMDACSDKWMSTWKQRFEDLKISQLRSPLFFHPDPRDRDGLLAFAHESGRVAELCEIPNVVGKELSKHESKRQRGRKQARTTVRHLRIDGRDQIDYFTPSTKLFDNYCEELVEHYGVGGLVQRAEVLDIKYEVDCGKLEHGLFTIKTSSKGNLFSRIVVVATGASKAPSVPNLHQLPMHAQRRGSITHVFQPSGASLPVHVHRKLIETSKKVNVVVIGGGLTSAQLSDVFLRQYPRNTNLHIHLLLRHPKLKCKPFDIDLPWVSKTRNHLMSTFWSSPTDEERFSMLRKARNGGSVNPPYIKVLRQHISKGRLTIHCNTELSLDQECVWDDQEHIWTKLIIQSPSVDESTPKSSLSILSEVDHIVYCTGTVPSFKTIPFLSSMMNDFPIDTLGGFPVPNDDLMYDDEIPLFFTGALASLRLGPGAANLAGARHGAERIAWKVDDLLRRNYVGGSFEHQASSSADAGERNRSEYTGSFNNQFAALDIQGAY